MIRNYLICLAAWILFAGGIPANPPVASYLFPAGGQRGTTVPVRVGGLFLYRACSFELQGPGIEASRRVERMPWFWFEGPMLPMPDSQRNEDYPRDMAGQVRIAADAPLGSRRGRLWTAEGAASGLQFVVGDLPEVVEQEQEGDPLPVEVRLPVTINGRIFPRQDIDLWSFSARKGQTITGVVAAARIGSPLDARLEVLDARGKVLADNDDALGNDPRVRFTAPQDGVYQVRIQDVALQGGPAYVYRLTLTADAYVDYVYPLGGRRGTRTRFELAGQQIPPQVELDLPASGPADYQAAIPLGQPRTNIVLLDLDDLPEILEAEPNDEPDQAAVVELPALVNGRIGRPGDVDCWRFQARKGEALALQLRATQLGSPLQGVLVVCDAQGKQLGRAEAVQADPVLNFVAPADGNYCVKVMDRFRSRGGPAFAYRLRLAPPVATPDFRLLLPADTLILPRGGTTRVKIQVERTGSFSDAITLAIAGLPAGVKATGLQIDAKKPTAEIVLTAEASAHIEGSRLTIQGTATIAGKTVAHPAVLALPRGQAAVDSLLLAVTLPVPFKLVAAYDSSWSARGSVHRKKYTIERGGYDGPLEVSIADRQARHLQGVTGPVLVVPAGANEFEYPVQLPPWMEIGRTCRVCVMAVGTIKDGAGEHEIAFSAVGQNDQMITVVETGRLGIMAGKTSLRVTPGGSVALPVRLARGKGLVGPVKVELILAGHVRGVTAAPVTVAMDQEAGTLTIQFARDNLGPFNHPAIIRATVAGAGGPVIAETQVELVGE